jgi:hypothetical protein
MEQNYFSKAKLYEKEREEEKWRFQIECSYVSCG